MRTGINRLVLLSMGLAWSLVAASSVSSKGTGVAPARNILLGNVLAASGTEPAPRVVVTLKHFESGASSSATTTATGVFILSRLADGAYHVAVETKDGLFVSEGVVKLHGAARRPISLWLEPGRVSRRVAGAHGLSDSAKARLLGTLELTAQRLRLGR